MRHTISIVCLLLMSHMLEADVQSSNQDLDNKITLLKTERDETALKAQIAGRNADRIMEQDWTEYRHEIERQELLEQKVHELDTQITELEKQKGEKSKTG